MIAKLKKPRAKEVQIEAMEYQMTDRVSPRRVPIRSMNRPQIVWPNEGPVKIVFKVWGKKGERLAVNIIDDRRSEQQATNPPTEIRNFLCLE